jgi:hypothetical protein
MKSFQLRVEDAASRLDFGLPERAPLEVSVGLYSPGFCRGPSELEIAASYILQANGERNRNRNEEGHI